MTGTACPDVILIHGLWYRGASTWPLARRLGRRGYRVQRFSYASILGDWRENVRALQCCIRAVGGGRVQLVAHSLGGLLALEALAAARALPVRGLIMLGTPLAGSAAARRLAGIPGLRGLLGRSAVVLCSGTRVNLAALGGRYRLVMIAGTRQLGLGRLLVQAGCAGDGTVVLEETCHAALDAHYRVETGHTGLLLSREVAGLVARECARLAE